MINGVSRETNSLLRRYENLLKRWNERINLVSSQTLDEFSHRHVNDCLQLNSIAPSQGTWLDLGSGGGLPGLVIAIARRPQSNVVLVESDHRKAAFLKTVRRELELDVQIIVARIEALDPLGADIISARALAPLEKLLEYQCRHGHGQTVGLYPKGRTWEADALAAEKEWAYDLKLHPSLMEKDSMILEVQNLARL
ncbi:Ribosomal RNA small subunit methyltransferase G [Jannaschia seosinensis]|uniref:Ribosomal RNA small subunit methyltransferase G n=1 Tax=Jannaschia seosinensis TaxID=313367 RepID=A0A0M7BC66_9RHOB|nr:16S rRNA (guanine(527)-N(7))-methyltransferase RsmG [Jannaschia seosinensis]CUH39414.1 Ribosomal RNA small subunit methyltransferase G [Jannaschia seosinensis]